MNKIGFNLLAWSGGIGEELFPVCDRLKKIGYDGIECFMAEQDLKAYTRFGNHLKSVGLEATCVTGLGPDENPASESPGVRARALDILKYTVDRAHAMNASIIAGPIHSAFAYFGDRHAPNVNEYAWSAEVLRAAGEYAAQAGILLTPEALNRFECYLCNTMEQLHMLIQNVNHPHVKAMFDTHHANIEEKKLSEAIRRIAPVLAHVHISENDRGTPGDGHIAFEETFSTLKDIGYKGWLTIEAFTRNDPGFANSINVWREYSKPWDTAEKGYAFIREQCAKAGIV